jgi:bifunctional ADP-heptose synthase (sugar kinase/adenylyltransferase)
MTGPNSGLYLCTPMIRDAFSSTVVAALALGKTFEEAMMWGPINAMSVVQKIGAQEGLLSRTEMEQYLENAPADYKVKNI